MSRRIRPKKPANLGSWRVIIMRSKGEHIGTVEEPDRERAEAAAIKQWSGFNRAVTDRKYPARERFPNARATRFDH